MKTSIKLVILNLLIAASAMAANKVVESVCQLRINTDPAGALITCDGKIREPAPLVLTDLTPGEHLIVASKEGYNETRKTFTITKDQRLALDLKLERITGLVIIHSEPAGADIKIDGTSRGKTPLFLDDLPPGIYKATMTLGGFQPKDIELNIPDRSPVKISVNLASDSATLTVKSTPEGAAVTINGIAKGQTPCTIDKVQQGEATIEMTLEGCDPFRKTIKLTAGQTEEINATLKELPAELSITSTPDKAKISIDNQPRGQAPITIKDLPPGTYRVRAEQKGYEPMARNVTLTRAQKAAEQFGLIRNAGILEITTEPAGVKVFLDGEEIGSTKAKADATDLVSLALQVELITNGKHQVQLSKEGYDSDSFEITIEKDKSSTNHKKLKRKFIKDYWVRTSDTTYEGMLLSVDPVGAVRLEVAPGIIKNFTPAEIRQQGHLKTTKENNPQK